MPQSLLLNNYRTETSFFFTVMIHRLPSMEDPTRLTPNLVREVNLIGNTVKQITMAQLNAKLAAANYNLTLGVFSHDVTPLPNGHRLAGAGEYRQKRGLEWPHNATECPGRCRRRSGYEPEPCLGVEYI